MKLSAVNSKKNSLKTHTNAWVKKFGGKKGGKIYQLKYH
jgi:hypothetical protein